MCEAIVILGILFRCCAVIFSGNIYMVSISPLSQVDLLALGVLLSCRERNLHSHFIFEKMLKHSLAIGFTGLIITIITVGIINDNLWHGYTLLRSSSNYLGNAFTAQIFFFIGLISVGLIRCCIKDSGIIPKIMNLSVFNHIGKISYGLYVFHWPVLACVSRLFENTFLITAITLTATYTGAVVSFYTYERFFMRLKHKFAYQELLLQKQSDKIAHIS